MEELCGVLPEAKVKCKGKDYLEAIKLVEPHLAKFQDYSQRLAVLLMTIAQQKWDLFDKMGRLWDAYNAAKSIGDRDEKRFVDLLIEMHYNMEARVCLRSLAEDGWNKERVAILNQRCKDVDSKALLQSNILKLIIQYYVNAEFKDSSSHKKSRQKPIFSLCKATAKLIPRLFRLSINSTGRIILNHIWNCQQVKLCRSAFPWDALKLLCLTNVKYLVVQSLTISLLSRDQKASEEAKGHVLKFKGLETLILRDYGSNPKAIIDISGVKNLYLDTENHGLCGDISSVQSLTIKNVWNGFWDNHFENLTHFHAHLHYRSDKESFYKFLVRHRATLSHLTINSTDFAQVAHKIIKSGVIEHLHFFQLKGKVSLPEKVFLELKSKLSMVKEVMLPEIRVEVSKKRKRSQRLESKKARSAKVARD